MIHVGLDIFQRMFHRLQKIVNTGFSICINWNIVLAFVCFWSFGFFGYFSNKSFGLVNNGLITLLTLSIFLAFLFLGLNNKGKVYEVSPETVKVFTSYFVVLVVLSWGSLTYPVNGDHLTYIQHAKAHSYFIVEKISQVIPQVATLPFWFVAWLVEVFMLVSFLFGCLLLKKINKYKILVIAGVVFIALRAVVISQGGNTDPFPALGLFPIWLSSVLFPGTDFGFRFAFFIPYITFVTCVYYFARLHFSKEISWLFGFLVATIPVFWHVATIVEFSIWTAIGWAVFLLWTINDKERKVISLQMMIFLLVICSAIRISGPAALAPLLLIVFYEWYVKKINTRELFFLILPISLLLPNILLEFFVGHTAAYVGNNYSSLGIIEGASLFERLKISIISGVFGNAVLNTFIIPYVLIAGILPIILLYKKKYLEFSVTISLFAIAYVMFYSIDPFLWGNGRYQAELIFPFLVASLFLCLQMFTNTFFKICVLILGICFNFFYFFTIPSRNEIWYGRISYFPQAKIRDAYFILSEYPIYYERAFDEARKHGYEGKVYYPGYLFLLSNLSGDSVKSVLKEKYFMNTVGASIGTSTASSIDKNKDIQIVFMPMYQRESRSTQEDVYLSLKKAGWVDWVELYDPVFMNTIRGLKRKE